MRTLEQIKRENYENLTYGELCEYNLDCDVCPLKDEFCNGGVMCYGGEPIEPPCCSFNDDTILSEVYDNFFVVRYNFEKQQEEKERQLELKKQKSEERKKKLREYKHRNWDSLLKIDFLKKKIKQEEKRIEFINRLNTFSNAVNFTNKIFRECNQPNNVKDIDTQSINDAIEECKQHIKEYNGQIIEIKTKIKESEKFFKQNQNKGN